MHILFASLVSVMLFFSSSSVEGASLKSDSVTFITNVDLMYASKDGIYCNGIVIDLNYEEIKNFEGKAIEIIGILELRMGIENLPKEYDDQGHEIVRQGRKKDVIHISNVKYRILE